MGTDATAPAQPQAKNSADPEFLTPEQVSNAHGSQAHIPAQSGNGTHEAVEGPVLPPHAYAGATALAVVVDPKAEARLKKLRSRVSSPAMRIREDMQSHLETMLPQLVQDAAEGKLNRLAFSDFLAKYGLGTNTTLQIVSPDVIARLERQVSLIASRDQWDSAELLSELRDVWA